ncbi:cupin domain-containing protein, partial [Clostridium sp.]
MKSAQYYIEKLNMISHVEGGYFKESVVSEDFFREDKKLFSSIYFLLETGEVSHFHRLTSDEMWYYHDGQA